MIDIAFTYQVALLILFSYFGMSLFVLKYGEVRTKLLWIGAWAILIGWVLYYYHFMWGLYLLILGSLLLAYYIAKFFMTIIPQI